MPSSGLLTVYLCVVCCYAPVFWLPGYMLSSRPPWCLCVREWLDGAELQPAVLHWSPRVLRSWLVHLQWRRVAVRVRRSIHGHRMPNGHVRWIARMQRTRHLRHQRKQSAMRVQFRIPGIGLQHSFLRRRTEQLQRPRCVRHLQRCAELRLRQQLQRRRLQRPQEHHLRCHHCIDRRGCAGGGHSGHGVPVLPVSTRCKQPSPGWRAEVFIFRSDRAEDGQEEQQGLHGAVWRNLSAAGHERDSQMQRSLSFASYCSTSLA